MADDPMGRTDALGAELPIPNDGLHRPDQVEVLRFLECQGKGMDLERCGNIGEENPSRTQETFHIVHSFPRLWKVEDDPVESGDFPREKLRFIHVPDHHRMVRRTGGIQGPDVRPGLIGMLGAPFDGDEGSAGANHSEKRHCQGSASHARLQHPVTGMDVRPKEDQPLVFGVNDLGPALQMGEGFGMGRTEGEDPPPSLKGKGNPFGGLFHQKVVGQGNTVDVGLLAVNKR
jgi:hypothetical protein